MNFSNKSQTEGYDNRKKKVFKILENIKPTASKTLLLLATTGILSSSLLGANINGENIDVNNEMSIKVYTSSKTIEFNNINNDTNINIIETKDGELKISINKNMKEKIIEKQQKDLEISKTDIKILNKYFSTFINEDNKINKPDVKLNIEIILSIINNKINSLEDFDKEIEKMNDFLIKEFKKNNQSLSEEEINIKVKEKIDKYKEKFINFAKKLIEEKSKFFKQETEDKAKYILDANGKKVLINIDNINVDKASTGWYKPC